MATNLPTVNEPCSGCGLCCAEQGTPPFSYDEGDEPPPWLDQTGEEHEDRYDRGLPCLWLDLKTRTCIHYDYRPRVCREFKVHGKGCVAFLLANPSKTITPAAE